MITENKKIRNVVKIMAVLAAVAAVVAVLGYITSNCIQIFGYGEAFRIFSDIILQGIYFVFRLAIAFSLFLAATLNKKWMLIFSFGAFMILNIMYPIALFINMDPGFTGILGILNLLPIAVSILSAILIKEGKTNKVVGIISCILNILPIVLAFLFSVWFVISPFIHTIIGIFSGFWYFPSFVNLIEAMAYASQILFIAIIFIAMTVITIGAAGIKLKKKEKKAKPKTQETKAEEPEETCVVTCAGPGAPAASSETNVGYADEIVKLKELYDMGAITEEEFSKKKKELLGI